MARIVVIDDAIQDNLLQKPVIERYCLEDGLFCQSRVGLPPGVHNTHGTMVAKVLQTYAKECEIISVQILDDWFAQRKCSSDRLIAALEFCGQLNVDAIHCSIGTERLSRIRKCGNLLEAFLRRDIPIIAAGSNAGYRTIPASCPGVFGVMSVEDDMLPPGTFAFAEDLYLGTEWIANYALSASESVRFPRSSSLAAPVVTAQINNLLNQQMEPSLPELTKALKRCAWPDIGHERLVERQNRTPAQIPIVYLVDSYAQDEQEQSALLDVFALHGYEAFGITMRMKDIRDVRLLNCTERQAQSLADIQARAIASARMDLLIVFLTSSDVTYWQTEGDSNAIVLQAMQAAAGCITTPQEIYQRIVESIENGYDPEKRKENSNG